MESGEEQGRKQSPPSENRFAKLKRKLQGPVLVGASILAGFGAKGTTDNAYSSETGTSQASTQEMNQKAIIPEVARDIEQEKTPVPFVNVMQGTDSKFVEAVNVVISDPASWVEYWNMINKDPNRPLPEIDFSKNVLILAAQGSSTGERNMIEIKNVNESKDTIEVEIESTIPSDSCPLLPGETSSFQLVSIPKTDKAIDFNTSQDEGCYDINSETSSRYDPVTGKAIYNPSTVTKTPYEPPQ